ncbi:hypothetical protein [Arenicella xantha]|uniref:Uncharacterized protein n=1 Tax=Arenicella xantha TaxID=644221 RepID=A0A395JM68_9GAMM|nr:hypothetical protein [Arenicella xantha]RBP50758.1 hypothetical protein DFR28_102170 [Arenicella xantha]
MLGHSPNVKSDQDYYVSKYSLAALTPNHVLSQFTRSKRRNLILGISVSLALLYLATLDPKLELSSILFIKFSEPLRDLNPVFWMMAIFIAYFELSFLFDFYSDIKRIMVSIDGLRFYRIVPRSDWVRKTDQFDFGDREECVIRLKGLNPDAAIGDKRVEVETGVTVLVSDLYLTKSMSKRAEWAVRLRKMEAGGTSGQSTWNVISDEAMTSEESTYITKARSEWSKKVMKRYRKKLYGSLLWWYEIFLPLVVGLMTLVYLLKT